MAGSYTVVLLLQKISTVRPPLPVLTFPSLPTTVGQGKVDRDVESRRMPSLESFGKACDRTPPASTLPSQPISD